MTSRAARRIAIFAAILVACACTTAATAPEATAAVTTRTPVMGPSLLNAGQLAKWYVRHHGSIAPNIPGTGNNVTSLAQIFIDQGRAEGVRGDIAFVQSMLETGWLGFQGSQIPPDANNFAGIFAFNGRPSLPNCSHGDSLPSRCMGTPQHGVRVQMQLLRSYADPSAKTLSDRFISAPSDRAGMAPLWEYFGGHNCPCGKLIWASADDYGLIIIRMYSQAVAESAGGYLLGNIDGVGGQDLVLRRGGTFYVDLGANGSTDRRISWGRSTDEAYIANPDGAGGDDLILRRGSTFYVDLGANGSTDRSFSWGRSTDRVLVANPDGVGGDDLILRRGSTFFVDFGFNGNEDRSFSWGRGTDEPYIANPDRAGGDDLILRRGNTFFVDLGFNGSTNRSFSWGRSTDRVLVANPDGVGGDDLILRRGSTFFVDFGFNGNEDRSFSWGRGTDEAYIANPDRAGGDDLILRRGSTFFVDLGFNGNQDRSFPYGRSTDQIPTRR